MLGAFVACAPEVIKHPTEAGIVSASTVEPVITVDQEINQVTFNIPEGTKAVIPVWLFQDKNGEWTSYSAQDGLKKIYTKAGDYAVRMYLMNASGVSPDYVEKSFHIDNTIMNFDKYVTFIAGGTSASSKEWRIDNSLQGHLGCGPSGTTGKEWWSAQPDDKKDWGVYDNRMTFGSDYSYVFDPGDAGTIYVNWEGVTKSEYTKYYEDTSADYNVPADVMSGQFSFDVVGDDLYLVLPEGALWPYFPNDDFIDNPRLKIESITAKAIELIADNGSIAWHFSLTSGAAVEEFSGYKYKADSNLWKPIDDNSDYTITSMYYAHGNDWAAYPDGSMTYVQEGAKWTVSLPYESDQQWQAQFHVQPTSLPLSATTNYDFSCIINSSTTFGNVTVKLTDSTDDGNFLFAESFAVNAYEDYIFYLTDLAGIDAANTKLVFDFGGCRENTELVIRNIVLKDHAIDDGTVLPGDPDQPEEPEEGAHYDVDNAGTNFWLSSEVGFAYWYSAGDWSGALVPEYEWLNDAQKDFKVVIPEGIGGSEWMGQTHFTIDHAITADKLYDFCATINASSDFVCTVKVAWEGNDNNHAMFYVNDFSVTAFEDCTFKMPAVAPDVDYDKVAVFFDFGRTAPGTEITISDVCLQEHQEPHTGGGDDEMKVSGTELWDNTQASIVYWYADAGWGQIADPECTAINGGWSFIMPEGIGGSEWQGQTHFTMPVAVSAAKKYQFKVTLNSSVDCTCTVKLAWEGNDTNHAMFYDNNVQLKAYEDIVYVQYPVSPDMDYDKVALFVDLGRTPAGAEVQIKDISLIEVVEPTDIWDSSKVQLTYWYSAGDWSGQLHPEISEIDNGWKLVMPEGIGGSEWMGQTHFTLDTPIFAAKKYDFNVTINSSADCVCTVKMAMEGDDSVHAAFYVNDFQLTAYEDCVFSIKDTFPDVDYEKVAVFIDLGRTPAGAEVEIKNFHLFEK